MAAFTQNTNVIDLTGLLNEIGGTYINDATVSVTVKDAAGANVAGAAWPLTMNYVIGSDGGYATEFGLTPSARARLALDPPPPKKSKFDGLIG